MLKTGSFIVLGLCCLIWYPIGLEASQVDRFRIQHEFTDLRKVEDPLETTKGLRKVFSMEVTQLGDELNSSQLKVPIGDDAIMHATLLCYANPLGNYQNPFNCSTFLMCAPGRVFLWECPASGSYYPVDDTCVYKAAPSGQCPWRSMWYGNIDCPTLGKRAWWSGLTIPVDPPSTRCGSKIRFCFGGQEIWTGECAPGYGYSKSYNGCLPMDVCLAVDRRWFDGWIM